MCFIKFSNMCRSVIKGQGYIKILVLVVLLVISLVGLLLPRGLNTVYSHYGITPGANEGLKTDGAQGFILNGKPITITAGLVHHYRVHPHYWRDRLRKLRSAGVVAVKTTLPWNLHESYKNVYDFGDGNFEMSQFLDIVKFIKIAREEDLLVILGLGPYINADLDFGGLPSYLLGEEVKIRTADPKFIDRVNKYFNYLLPLLAPLQIQNGGPIIMFQLENSYGAINADEIDKEYLLKLKNIVEENGITSLLFTSDPITASLDRGALPELGVLQTVNSETDVLSQMETLRAISPSSPVMVHFRSGIVDHLIQSVHNTWPTHEYVEGLQEVLQFNASVCIHVFHGGTTFGFLNGATSGDTADYYNPHTTSYDCDAPLTEAGDYSPKFGATLEMFRSVHPLLHHPAPPSIIPRSLSLSVPLNEELPWVDIVSQLPDQLKGVNMFCPMEGLPPVQDRKQSFGYVHYSFDFHAAKRNPKLKLLGLKKDVVMVLVNGWNAGPKEVERTKKFGFWDSDDEQIVLEVGPGTHRLELLVENWGRVSHAQSIKWLATKKGLTEENRVVLVGGASHAGKLNITGMPFLSSWVTSLKGWKDRVHYEGKGAPSLVRAYFTLTSDQISDTFLDTREWGRGVVYVNGFNIGRYFCGGPQQSLYIPAPLLQVGENNIIIFEHYVNPYLIKLTTDPIFL